MLAVAGRRLRHLRHEGFQGLQQEPPQHRHGIHAVAQRLGRHALRRTRHLHHGLVEGHRPGVQQHRQAHHALAADQADLGADVVAIGLGDHGGETLLDEEHLVDALPGLVQALTVDPSHASQQRAEPFQLGRRQGGQQLVPAEWRRLGRHEARTPERRREHGAALSRLRPDVSASDDVQ